MASGLAIPASRRTRAQARVCITRQNERGIVCPANRWDAGSPSMCLQEFDLGNPRCRLVEGH